MTLLFVQYSKDSTYWMIQMKLNFFLSPASFASQSGLPLTRNFLSPETHYLPAMIFLQFSYEKILGKVFSQKNYHYLLLTMHRKFKVLMRVSQVICQVDVHS